MLKPQTTSLPFTLFHSLAHDLLVSCSHQEGPGPHPYGVLIYTGGRAGEMLQGLLTKDRAVYEARPSGPVTVLDAWVMWPGPILG